MAARGQRPSGERYADAYIHTRAGSKTYKGKFGPDVYCDFLVDFIHANKAKPMMIYFPMALTHWASGKRPEAVWQAYRFTIYPNALRIIATLLGTAV